MATVVKTKSIPIKAQAIWDVLAEFDGIAEWADFVEHSTLLCAGPLEVGLTRRIQMGATVVLERIVDVEAPTALAYEIEGLPERISSVRNRWTLSPTGVDSTNVSISTTVAIGPRPPQQLAERVLGWVLARRSVDMLDGLAAHLEDHRV